MPEGIEIEYYRREAEKTIARTIVAVEANDCLLYTSDAADE